MPNSKVIVVKETPVKIIEVNQQDYISLTDMIKPFGEEIIIYNWLRNRNTIEFLGIWELIYNPNFNPIEFDRVKKQAGLNSFALSPKNGSKLPMPLASFQKLAVMGEEYTPTKTSPLNSVAGSVPSLNYTSLKNFNA